jgi:hypothetical protein
MPQQDAGDPQSEGLDMSLDLSSFYQTVNTTAIDAFDLGQYLPSEACMIFNTPGIATDNVPKFINRSAINQADTTDLDRVTETEENVSITPDTVLKEWQYIGKDQINRVGPEYAAGLGRKIGRAVAEGYSDRIAALLAVTAMTGSQTNTFDDESTDAEVYAAAIENAFGSLDNAKVPHMGRFVLCKPSFFRYLIRSQYFGSSDYRGPAAAEMPNLANSFTANGAQFISWPSPIFSADWSSNTSVASKYRRNFSNDNIHALAFSDETIGVAIKEAMNVSQDYVPHKSSWLIQGRMHIGTAALQSTGVRAIVGDANTT